MNLLREERGGTQSLGVDIGTREMKLVLLTRSDDDLSVDLVKTVPLTPGVVLDGAIEDRKELASALRGALGPLANRSIKATLSVPTQLATLRWVSLPRLSPEEHRVAASYKVKKHLSYPIEEAYLSTTPVQVVDEDGVGESLVISVPKNIIASRASSVDRAGIRPAAAELEAQALLRIVERSLGYRSALLRDASMTIIDIGGTNTEMYVVQNQKLQFIRSTRFGSSRIAHKVAEELSVSDTLANQMLDDANGHLDMDGILTLTCEEQVIKVSIKKEIETLLKEISRLMRYFRSLHAERSYAGILDHMMLCGGLANLNGLGEYLEHELRVRFEPLEPFGHMTFNLSAEAFELASKHENSFAIAVGLALSPFETDTEETQDVSSDFAWARSA